MREWWFFSSCFLLEFCFITVSYTVIIAVPKDNVNEEIPLNDRNILHLPCYISHFITIRVIFQYVFLNNWNIVQKEWKNIQIIRNIQDNCITNHKKSIYIQLHITTYGTLHSTHCYTYTSHFFTFTVQKHKNGTAKAAP